jgi:SAM-dependent methyltransferase
MSTTPWPNFRCPVHEIGLLHEASCLSCPRSHDFLIINGIPRFVAQSNYADHFGLQWNHFRRTQLDSYTKVPTSRDRLRRCIGETLWKELPGKLVLECGCGAGRFTEVLLERGCSVMSIDLSNAVDANAQNCEPSEFHRLAQADIGQLPFELQQFDLVLCLGVVQHTPDPELTMRALYGQVKPGGWLVIDHYTDRLGWYTKVASLFRVLMKRMPPDRALAMSERLVDLFLPLHKSVRRVPIIRSVVYRLSPVISYYTALPELDDRLQYEWARLDTHDSLTDWFRAFRTRTQITQAFDALGMDAIWCEYGGNGVEARGQRPLRSGHEDAG